MKIKNIEPVDFMEPTRLKVSPVATILDVGDETSKQTEKFRKRKDSKKRTQRRKLERQRKESFNGRI